MGQPAGVREQCRALATSAIVGRQGELASVRSALEHGPALVLVEGEPGIGKTRLLREILAARQDSVVLVAACPPLREPFPLGPVVDGLRRLREQVGDVELSPLGGALRSLFPEWGAGLPPALEPLGDPKETRHRLFRALTELIERLNVEILVVEDAHWADTATLEWLLTLTSVADHGISIVTTFRPTDVPEDSLLLRLRSRLPSGMDRLRVELQPLDVEQTRELVGSMFGTHDVSEKFTAFLHNRADGIPLAIEESVRLLWDRHDIERHDGRWTWRLLEELEVPPTVRDSVLERVARLPAESRQVLEAAAVLAAPAGETLLAEVAGLDEDGGRVGVAAALVSGLLQEASPGQFGFRHVLDAMAVGDAIPVSQRRRLHSTAGEVLRRAAHPPVVRLARHTREAGDAEAWCRYGEASADLARESGDDRTAIATLLDLLTAMEHPVGRRARLVRKLGQTTVGGAAPLDELAPRVVATLRSVLAGEDLRSVERGEIRVMLGKLHSQLGEYDAAREEIEAALADLEGRPAVAARQMLYLAMPHTRDWPVARHLMWIERATELLPQVESRDERLSFAVDRANALLSLGEEAGWRAAAQLPRSASAQAGQRQLARGQLNIGYLAVIWGRYDDARRRLTEAIELGKALGFERLVPVAVGSVALLDWYTGRWGGLSETLGTLVEAEDTQPLSRMEARRVQGLLGLAAGDRAMAEDCLRGVAEEYARLGVAYPVTVFAPAALARLRLADGAASEACELTGPEMAMVSRKGVWLWATDIAPVHVDALVGVGELDRAGEQVEQFATWLAGRQAPAPAAAVATCRAILAEATREPAAAAAVFGEAAEAWAGLPRPYDELLALERRGGCLLAAGEQDKGLAELTGAEQRLRQLGAKRDADRVARLLRQHGVEVSRAWKRGPRGYGEQLSPREREVLALVARGMTNREAGQVLFLSPKTVGVHLSAAMRKLGVSSRTAAAMAAAEAGLLSADGDVSANG